MQTLPAGVADVLRPLLPTLSDEITAAVAREVEPYRRPLEGPFGQAVQVGTERALSRFVDLIGDPEAVVDERSLRTYVELGRGEFRQGRSLDALLRAYRVGARIAWRRFAEAADAAALEPRVVYRLGEAVFSYIDEISAESAEGWAAAQSAVAGERQRRRARLVALLATDPPPDDPALRATAHEAGWPVPTTVAAVASAEADEERLAGRLGPDVIAASFDGVALALVPDPDAPGRLAQLERVMGDRACAIGPSVPLREAARSVARARHALRLAGEDVLPATGLVRADEHLPAMALHAEPSLARELATRELAPLEALPATSRAKLEETLRVWLDHRGRVEETAHHLAVHPQTVRYRVNQLRELFGTRLEDPEARHALALALRVTPL